METSNIKTDWLFWGGIVVGIFVMFVGTGTLMWRSIDTASARLILCSGLGILFGAFGAAAVVKYKGLTITGVAAIAIALLYVVVTLTRSQITFGTITGDIKGALIEIKGDQIYLGATRGRSYDFVVESSGLKRPVFDVYINFPPGTSGKEEEIPFEDIDKKYIERFIGTGHNIEWRFDRTKGRLVDTATFDLGDPRVVPLALAAASASDTSSDGLYLSIFVIQGAYHRLSPAEKQTTREKLQALRPKAGPETQRLIDSLTM